MNIVKSMISTIGIFALAVIVLAIAVDKGYAKMADPVKLKKIVEHDDYKKHVVQMEQAESKRLGTGMILREKSLKPHPVHAAIKEKPEKAIKEKPEKAVPKHKKVDSYKAKADRTSQFSDYDKKIMAKAVYGEARGETFRGQVAVAAVILNRIGHTGFPDSVQGVVYQENAFTAVEDGQIHLKPDQKAVRAVEKAIQGEDPTDGAVYYYNPETATSKWMKEKAVGGNKTRIGEHVFMK